MLRSILKHVYHYLVYYDERINYKISFLIWCSRKKHLKWICDILRIRLAKINHVIMPRNPDIGYGLVLAHPQNIVLGQGVKIGNDCLIYHDVTIGQKNGKYPTIGNNVIIYPGVKIIGEVVVGNNAIIGANAVVMTDIPDNAIAVGIPARIIQSKKE